MPFDDRDMYKIIESASMTLISAPNPVLQQETWCPWNGRVKFKVTSTEDVPVTIKLPGGVGTLNSEKAKAIPITAGPVEESGK